MHPDSADSATPTTAQAPAAPLASLPPMPVLADNAVLRQLLDEFQAAAARCNAEQSADARQALLEELERQMADYARQAVLATAHFPPTGPARPQLT